MKQEPKQEKNKKKETGKSVKMSANRLIGEMEGKQVITIWEAKKRALYSFNRKTWRAGRVAFISSLQ